MLLVSVTYGSPSAQAYVAEQLSFSGRAQISGPVHLQVTVTPPIGRPRDRITIELTATSRLNEPVSPTIQLALPPLLSSTLARYPTATTFDFQQNRLSWQPVLRQNGDSVTMALEYAVALADLRHPAQTIAIQMAHGDTMADTSVDFWVGSAPSTSIAIDRPVVAVGQTVRLVAVPSGPGPFTQTWLLGDGRQIVANDPEVSFALPGIYEVRLQVANPLAVATALSAVTVVSQPTASFYADDELPVAGQPVQFLNTSGGERPLQMHWEFGDGSGSQELNPVHTYAEPGAYEVRLVVSSAFGESEVTMALNVGAHAIADFVLPEMARTGEPVQVMGFGDESVSALRWDMGDGALLQGEVISHIYHRSGEFVVTLFAINDYGETQIAKPIIVVDGLHSVYMPFISTAGLAPGETTTESQGQTGVPAPDAAAPGDAPQAASEPFTTLLEQSGSSLPVTGVTNGAIPPGPSLSVDLPAQAPLAPEASVAEQLLWYVNEARRLHGLAPLAYNYELSIAAQHHAVDMAANPDVMHVGSDGSRPAERQQHFGYSGAYGGEAVAWGWESPVPVVEFWVNSPPHRILILNPEAGDIGVGHMADGFAPNIWYWAVEFGVRP